MSFVGASAGVAQAQLTVEALTSSAVGDSSTAPFYDDVQDAIRRFEKGDIEGARKLLELARKSQPKLAPVEVMMAQMLLAANQQSAARAELERALRDAPKDPEAYLVLGESNIREGRVSEASMMYKQAAPVVESFTENPKRKEGFLLRLYSGAASAAEAREDWAGARDELTKLIAAEEKHPAETKEVADAQLAEAHLRLARALFKLDDAAETYKQLQAAAAIEPKKIAPEVAIAGFYKQAKKTDKADSAIAKAIKVAPGNFATLAALSRWMFEANKISDAVSYCDAAMKLEPNNTEIMLSRAILARMQKDNKKAQELLEHIHMETPINGLANNQLALVLAESKDEATLKRAVQFAELNAKLNPKNAEALATLGWTLYKAGNKADAQRALAAAMQGGQLQPDAAFFTAVMLNDMDRKRDALKFVDGALLSEAPFAYHDEAAALQTRLTRARDRARRDSEKEKESEATAPETKPSETPARPTSTTKSSR